MSGRRLLSGHSVLSDVTYREPGAFRSGRFSTHFTIQAERTERSRPGRQCETPTLVPRELRRSNGKSIVPCPTHAAWSCRMRRTGGQSTSDPFLGRNPAPTSTPFGSSLPVLISNTRDFSLTSLIASIALIIRLSITCWSWIRSPRTTGKSFASCMTHRSEGAPFGQPSEARRQPRLMLHAGIGLAPRQVLRPS
jgi:hypothetical protein